MIALLAVALAQTPAPDPVPLEVTVWGEPAVRQARAAVVREARDAGWRKGREDGGRIVLKPPEPWMGRAVLDYDGTLSFRRPVVALASARLENPVEPGENPHFDRDPGGMRYGEDGYALPHPAGTFWFLPRRAVLDPAHARLRERLAPLLDEYREVVEVTRERD